ncbi:hypothetical protein N2152v2_003368 [Parachlorella kessleri]
MSLDGPALLIELGQYRLGSCLAWDRVTNLLAVEVFLPSHAGPPSCLAVCILEPSCPEVHFLARMPLSPLEAGMDSTDSVAPGEHLAHLLWSPPGAARCLLAVTSLGRAFQWTQEDPGHTAPHVCCINSWHGAPAFQVTAAGSLLSCRFLETPSPWDYSAAPPNSSREGRRVRSLAELQGFWRGHSVESAFLAPAPPAAASPAGAGAAGVHWVRPGALCCAVVTSQAQLQVLTRTFGGVGQPYRWAASPVVTLLPVLSAPLAHADVAAAHGATLRVLGTPAATHDESSSGEGVLMVAEVAGALCALDTAGGFLEQPTVSLTTRVVMGTGREVAHASFLPSSAGALLLCLQHDRLLGDVRVVVFSQTGASSGAGAEQAAACTAGLAGWAGAQAGAPWQRTSERVLCSEQRASLNGGAAVACSHSASNTALWLPPGQLVCVTGTALADPKSTPLPGPFGGLADSPNGCMVAVAAPGSSQLVLRWTLPSPAHADGSGQLATDVAKRLCFSLLTPATASSAGWDAVQTLSQVCRDWGPRPLALCCDMVDRAVHAEGHAARPARAAAWDHLKVALLGACAPPGSRFARCLLMDLGLRGWLAHCSAMFESVMPIKEELEAVRAEKGNPGLEALLLSRAHHVHFWITWLVDTTLLLLRSLLLWTEQRKQHMQQGSGKGPRPPLPGFGFGPTAGSDTWGGGGGGAPSTGGGASRGFQISTISGVSSGIGSDPTLTDASLWTSEGGTAGTAAGLSHGVTDHGGTALAGGLDMQRAQRIRAAAQQAQQAGAAWAAQADASPDCIPGARLLADVTFCKAHQRALHNAAIFAGRLRRVVPPGAPLLGRATLLPDLLKAFVSLAKYIQDSSVAEGLPAADPAAPLPPAAALKLTDATEQRFNGPWRLHYSVCNGGPKWEIVAATLARLVKMSPSWATMQGGSLDDILEGASILNLLPPLGSTAGGTSSSTLPADLGTVAVDELYRHMLAARQVAQARLEGTAALPSVAEGWDGGWGSEADWEEEVEELLPKAAQHRQGSMEGPGGPRDLSLGLLPGGSSSMAGAAGALGAATPSRQQEEPLGRKRRQQEGIRSHGCLTGADTWQDLEESMDGAELEARRWQWEVEVAFGASGGALDSTLSGPPKRVDVIAGRMLTWEHSIGFCSPCGTFVTGELRPEQLAPPGPSQQLQQVQACQLPYVAACPVAGRPWRKL